jgi:hypothetical protein
MLGGAAMSAPTEYELRFRVRPGHGWTGEQRLKKLLKFAGRVLGLECRACREVKPTANDQGGAKVDAAGAGADAPQGNQDASGRHR